MRIANICAWVIHPLHVSTFQRERRRASDSAEGHERERKMNKTDGVETDRQAWCTRQTI